MSITRFPNFCMRVPGDLHLIISARLIQAILEQVEETVLRSVSRHIVHIGLASLSQFFGLLFDTRIFLSSHSFCSKDLSSQPLSIFSTIKQYDNYGIKRYPFASS